MKNPQRINQGRLFALFSRLVEIDSESCHERKMADCLKAELDSLGFYVEEDDTKELTGADAGNIYAFLPGDLPGEPILFSAHMDTVSPGIGKKAYLHEDGRITSGKDTVLGADDLNAVSSIIEGIKCVLESGLPRRDTEIVFSVCEELYCRGIKAFDFNKLKAKNAYILDMSTEPGKAAFSAPTIISFEAAIKGKSSHAGFCPEEGIHAIDIMSRAVAALNEGRLNDETTFNIGYINGGGQTNIVPEECICEGEIRSLKHESALFAADNAKRIFHETAKKYGAECRFEIQTHIKAYKTDENSQCIMRFKKACKNLSLQGEIVKTFGGSDNNVFAQNGISGIVLSCGMNNVHSTSEYTTLKDLSDCAELVFELITLN